MKTTRPSALLLFLATTAAAPLRAQEARPFLYQPAPSPDGSEIAFVSSGDIWVVPAAGGDAHLLVSHEADESRPLYAPDGTRLAFVSDRDGDDDIYVLTLATGEVRRLTWGDGAEELDAWSPDGRWIYFADGRGDPDGKADVWRVSAGGGTPMRVLADRFAPEFHAAVSPDGRTLAIAAVAGMAQSQWWRHGHAHIDESEIWLATPGEPPSYRKLSESGSKNVSPMWSSDGSTLVYVSDRSGSENLWSQATGGGEARALTNFRDGRLLFPTVSADGRTVAFERDFGIWRMTLPDGRAERVAVTLDGAPQRTGIQHLSLTSGFGELSLSPDGKKVAFIARGEVFAASAKDGGQATRVTRTLAPEEEVAWAPDSRRIAYTSRRSGRPKLFLYDFGSDEERALTTGNGSDVTPRFSPDGAKVAYVRDGREVHVLDVASGSDRRVAEGQLWGAPFTLAEPLVWSPDGAWLAYFATDAHMFTNVWVVPSDGEGDPRPVSELANSSASSMAWSKDGKTIYFDTQQRTENGELARVDLVPRTPTFREDRFRDLFQEEKKGGGADSTAAAGEARDSTTRVVFEAVRRRLELLPTGVDVGAIALSPDGKTLVFTAAAEGQQNLYAYSVDPERDEPAVTRQITSTPGFKSLPRFTPDGKEVYFLDRGRIRAANVASGDGRAVAVTAELDVDFDQEKVEAFDEGWTYLRDDFYDAAYHGADWQAVRRTFEPYIRGAGTRAEYSRLMNMMVGELNASHLGHGVQGPSGPSTGELGVRFDRATYESSGRLRVTEVVHLGPADVSGEIASGRLHPRGGRHGRRRRHEPRPPPAGEGGRQGHAARRRRRLGRGRPHRDRAADVGRSGAPARIPGLGGGQSRLRRQRERRPARLRAHGRHGVGLVPAARGGPRRRQLREGRRGHRHPQQPRRLRERVRARRLRAPRLPDPGDPRLPGDPRAQPPRPAGAGEADGPGREPAHALGRGGLHGGIPNARAGGGGGRAHGRMDHLHVGAPARGRLVAAHAPLAGARARRPGHGA